MYKRSDRNFYQEGFETGKGWDKNYRPGGPWRCGAVAPDHRYYQMYLDGQENSREWFKGFDKGLEAQEVFKRLRA